jgi:predicted Zn-dependent protease
MKKTINSVLFLTLFAAGFACTDKNDNLVLFPVSKDVELGQQVAAEIASDPVSFPVLDPVEYQNAYDYLEELVQKILNSGEVEYKEEFVWEFKIIEDDATLNAFATPGGYIYVYTGLIKYLDNEDDFMGVLGHEIAHADLRHTSRNLQKSYGVSILLSILIGNDASQIETIAGQIAGTVSGLAFTRQFESEADNRSVEYLAPTEYACNGAAGFFQKLIDEGQGGSTPQFLSTHPNPDNRVEDINEQAAALGCSTTASNPASYQVFKNMLPQ